MKTCFKGKSSPLKTTFDSLIENHYLRSYNDLKFSQFYIIESIRVRNRVGRLYSTSVYLFVENLFTHLFDSFLCTINREYSHFQNDLMFRYSIFYSWMYKLPAPFFISSNYPLDLPSRSAHTLLFLRSILVFAPRVSSRLENRLGKLFSSSNSNDSTTPSTYHLTSNGVFRVSDSARKFALFFFIFCIDYTFKCISENPSFASCLNRRR